ncbi:ABC transporter permease [Psychrilyobacter atlanticus]|uniref:ABC transporter permease n=1 Tax=Psychrilyobacter atlanticus TaxID=271091 RepID=UPI000418345A|nr:ABC transporter permease [Psychrilyobacter atlanticus]
MIEFFIAKKHILERKRQSIIAILGVAIGVTVLTVSIGIANGLDKNMVDSILSISSHVVATKNGEAIDDYRELQTQIESIKGVKGAVPQISTQGILKYSGIFGSYVSGVKINGLDFDDAKTAMNIDKKIVAGTMEIKKPTEFLIGKELFDQLGAKLGDRITVVSADNREMHLTIVGVFQSGYYEYDTTMIIIPLRAVQILSYTGDTVTSLEVFLDDVYSANKVAGQIQMKTNMSTRTWGDLNRNLLAALSLEKTVMILVFSLIVIIAGFVVWVILNMLVKEKTRDIGIMRSMGFSSKNIMRIFMLEGLFLGSFGIVVGLSISGGILWYVKDNAINQITNIYYLNKIPVEITSKEVLVIVAANIVIIFLSSIFPAYKAAKLEVVEALKYD